MDGIKQAKYKNRDADTVFWIDLRPITPGE